MIGYWHGKFKDLDYDQNEQFEYSLEKQREIVDNLLLKGYSVMLRPVKDNLIIYIDNGRFGQR